MQAVPPIDLAEVVLLENLKINLGANFLRIFGIILLLFNSLLFSRLFKKSVIPFIIFLINPWAVFLHTFFTIQCLFLTSLLILLKKQGGVLFFLLSLIVFVYLQKTLPKSYLFLPKINFQSLALEINERQKIDFLATNKTYILPAVVRKIIYNKLALALDKIVRHFVSFFDFEQMISPSESYEITRLSGLSPKGNFPLFFIWEIPLIIYGIFLNRKLLPYLFILLLPIFTAEKKLFAQTAFLSLPIFLFWEVLVYQKITMLMKPRVLFTLAIIIIAIEVLPYYQTFYTKPLANKNSESYFFQEISRWIDKNRDKKMVVTTAFGPTEKMVSYYLGEIPERVVFQNFDLTTEHMKENTYYIGLPGQFVKKGKDLEKKESESRIQIIDKIKGEDELVFEYGANLWIGYQK